MYVPLSPLAWPTCSVGQVIDSSEVYVNHYSRQDNKSLRKGLFTVKANKSQQKTLSSLHQRIQTNRNHMASLWQRIQTNWNHMASLCQRIQTNRSHITSLCQRLKTNRNHMTSLCHFNHLEPHLPLQESATEIPTTPLNKIFCKTNNTRTTYTKWLRLQMVFP